MADPTQIPTLTEIYQAKLDIKDINTFTRSIALTFVDSDGITKQTLTGITAEANSRITAEANQVESAANTSLVAMAADVATVDASRVSAQSGMAADVSAVDIAADNALDEINTAAQQIPDAIKLIGGDWQFYTDITTIPTAGLVAGNRATDLDSGLQYQWAFYEGTSVGFWTPFLAGWGAPSHQNLPGRNAPNAHEAGAINMGGGLSLGTLLLKPIPSVSELRATPGNIDGQQVNLISRDGVSADGGGRLVWRASATNADDDVRWFAVTGVATGRWEFISGQIMSDITIRIPSDFATKQAAVDSIHGRLIPAQGVIFDLLMESGHVITAPLILRRGDYSYFTISAIDSAVTVNNNILTTTGFRIDNRPVFGALDACVFPYVNVKLDLTSYVDSLGNRSGSGFLAVAGSTINIGPNGGCIGSRDGAVAYDGSVINCENTDFKYSINSAITAWSNSRVYAAGADASFSERYGVRSTEGSSLVFINGTATDCARHASRAVSASFLDVSGATLARSATKGVYARNACIVNANNANVSDCGEHGIYALRASKVAAAESTATGSAIGYEANDESEISAAVSVANGCAIAALATRGGSVDFEFSTATGATQNAIYADKNGKVNGRSANLSGATVSAVLAIENGSVNVESANMQSCGGNAVYCRFGSTINASNADASGSNRGFVADAASITAVSANASNCSDGFYALNGGELNANSGIATGCTNSGALAVNGKVSAVGADLTGATNYGARVTMGGEMNLTDANCRKGVADSVTDISIAGGIVRAFGTTAGGSNLTKNVISAGGLLIRP